MQAFDIENSNNDSYFQKHEDDNQMWATGRFGFVQKVYSILSVQLLITSIFCGFSTLSESFSAFQARNMWLFFLCLISSIVILCMLYCCRDMARKVPTNYILLFSFTFCESYIVSTICGFTSGKIVMMAAVMTLGITVALTIYAMTTKTDFTVQGSLIYIMGMALLLFCFFSYFTDNKVFHIIITLITIIFYGIYLVYDTQLIAGAHKYSLEIDDYIIGAMILYVDIITLFLELIRLLNLFMDDK